MLHRVHCYEVETTRGRVVLHSTGVLFQTLEGGDGIAYLRPVHRLYHVPLREMPLPCASARQVPAALRSVSPLEFPAGLWRLLDFVRCYETWAARRLAPDARIAAWRDRRNTARLGVKWLPPAESARWLDACLAAAPGRGIAG